MSQKTTNEVKHTPTPWKANPRFSMVIENSLGDSIMTAGGNAAIPHDEHQANVRLAVKAVNEYASLKSQLQAAHEYNQDTLERMEIIRRQNKALLEAAKEAYALIRHLRYTEELTEKLDKAIAQAEGTATYQAPKHDKVCDCAKDNEGGK